MSVHNHRELMALLELIREEPFTGLTDCSVAYNSLSIFFDPVIVHEKYKKSPLAFTDNWLRILAGRESTAKTFTPGKEHLLPVCYDPPFCPDLELVARHCGRNVSDIIEIHTSQTFYVFMIGFSPGFPYMGILPETLETPRKSSPAIKVKAGSVGIAGQQTGIYPFTSPGGWNIIGRTPIRLFDVNEPSYCFFQAGDLVRFSRIDSETFHYLNQYEDR